LLDPHTGIPVPSEGAAEAAASHAPLPLIAHLNAALRPANMICFEQSYHRRHELSKPDQVEKKREFLRLEGIDSFYYQSHAPFLFMAETAEELSAVKERLISLGIPQDRVFLRVKRGTKRSTWPGRPARYAMQIPVAQADEHLVALNPVYRS
jgi:hypothetical protein